MVLIKAKTCRGGLCANFGASYRGQSFCVVFNSHIQLMIEIAGKNDFPFNINNLILNTLRFNT